MDVDDFFTNVTILQQRCLTCVRFHKFLSGGRANPNLAGYLAYDKESDKTMTNKSKFGRTLTYSPKETLRSPSTSALAWNLAESPAVGQVFSWMSRLLYRGERNHLW